MFHEGLVCMSLLLQAVGVLGGGSLPLVVLRLMLQGCILGISSCSQAFAGCSVELS
jgi:hypothetical protein